MPPAVPTLPKRWHYFTLMNAPLWFHCVTFSLRRIFNNLHLRSKSRFPTFSSSSVSLCVVVVVITYDYYDYYYAPTTRVKPACRMVNVCASSSWWAQATPSAVIVIPTSASHIDPPLQRWSTAAEAQGRQGRRRCGAVGSPESKAVESVVKVCQRCRKHQGLVEWLRQSGRWVISQDFSNPITYLLNQLDTPHWWWVVQVCGITFFFSFLHGWVHVHVRLQRVGA